MNSGLEVSTRADLRFLMVKAVRIGYLESERSESLT